MIYAALARPRLGKSASELILGHLHAEIAQILGEGSGFQGGNPAFAGLAQSLLYQCRDNLDLNPGGMARRS